MIETPYATGLGMAKALLPGEEEEVAREMPLTFTKEDMAAWREGEVRKACEKIMDKVSRAWEDYVPPRRKRDFAVSSYDCSDCGRRCGKHGSWGWCRTCYARRRKDVVKKAIFSSLGGMCEQCGETHIATLDLHHVDEAEKEYCVASIINSKPIAVVAKEAAKCRVLCSNCHRIHHHG